MNQERITIKDSVTGDVLAAAVYPDSVMLFEGTWYFDRKDVDMTHLVVSERTYICPYKGVCYWIDLEAPHQQVSEVAFTYFEIKPGYEFIQDKIGFYAGRRQATVEEAVLLTER